MPLDVRTYSVHSGSNPHTVGQELETLVLIWTSRAKGRWAWRGWAGERWVEVETFAEAETCPPGGGAAAEVTWLDVARRNTQVRPFFASTTLTCSSFKIVEILNWFHSLSVSHTLSSAPSPPPHTHAPDTLSHSCSHGKGPLWLFWILIVSTKPRFGENLTGAMTWGRFYKQFFFF